MRNRVAQGESKTVLMDQLPFCLKALERLTPGTESSCCLSSSLLQPSVYVRVK